FAAFALVVVALGLVVGAVPASAAPQVTVTPATDLSDGTAATVAWAGFAAGQTVNLLQCITPVTTSSCDVPHARLGVANPAGSGSAAYTVGEAACRAGKTCVIVVTEGGSSAAADNAGAPITFAGLPAVPPPPAAPPPTTRLPFTGTSWPLAAAGVILAL